MELVFLGTASGFPSPTRGASGLVLKNQLTGTQWLFDCGEGTQILGQKSNKIKLGKLNRIFISHTHGDHMYGLPGLLCTVAQKYSPLLNSTEEDELVPNVEIYGPQGLRRFLRIALGLSRSNLPFKYTVHELIMNADQKPENWIDWSSTSCDPIADPPLPCEIVGRDIHPANDGFFYSIFDDNTVNDQENAGFIVHAYALKHTIPCLGWLLIEPNKPPKLNMDRVIQLGVPKGPLLNCLKQGQNVTLEDGKLIKSIDVLDQSTVRGRRIAILGDSYNSDELLRLSLSLDITVDVLVHEATLEDALENDAISKGHSTPKYVTDLAVKLESKLLVFTHFSHRYQDLDGDKSTDSQGRPTLKVILDDARKNKKFLGDIQLATDLCVIKIPDV